MNYPTFTECLMLGFLMFVIGLGIFAAFEVGFRFSLWLDDRSRKGPK